MPTQDDAAPESQNQLLTALSIVGALTVLGGGLVLAGLVSKQWAIVGPMIGTVIGALATALNAPSGIGAVLKSAAKATNPQNQGPGEH